MKRRLMLSDLRLISLFFVSLCILAFEIEVMRVFSVSSWSNFGSMVISIALLGFGLAGTLLTFFNTSARKAPDAWLTASAFSLGPAMAVAHVAAQRVPFNPVLIATDPTQLWWIAAYYLAYSIPFFVAGIFIGASFVALSHRTHQLYFWNMVGSGLGGLAILGLMFLFPPDRLLSPILAASFVPVFLCSIRWSAAAQRFTFRARDLILGVALGGLSLLLVAGFGQISVSDFKPISYAERFPDAKEVYDAFSPRGQMQVYASSFFHFAPGLSDNASIELSKMPRNAFLGLYTDGDGPVGVMRRMSSEESGYIDFLPMSAPYLILSRPKALVLRLGGGAGVQTALHNGARQVDVVESNPDLIRMMKDTPYFKSYTGGMLEDPRVRIINNEVRAFAGSTQESYNLVEIGLIDSIGLSQAGGYSVEENYTYTVEAIREYMRCLAPGGILSITVWDRLSPPRNVPKLLSTVVEALKQSGAVRPENRIFTFSLLLSTATVLVKNGDFTTVEISKLNEYCRRMSFDVSYSPGVPDRAKDFKEILAAYSSMYGGGSESSPAAAGAAVAAGAAAGKEAPVDLVPSDLYHFTLKWLFGGRSAELFSGYVFDIRPATDDKPYYTGYIKPRLLPRLLPRLAEISEEWGYLLLLATLLQSLLFGFLIVLLPLLTRGRELVLGRGGTLRVILYFACLGLGYMMAEIFLIQRFVYFLADPVYTNAIVITVLLIASGIGSLLQARFSTDRVTAVRLAAAGIALVAVLYVFVLPLILRTFLGQPLPLKALIAAAAIAPLGLLLGIPFPTGLSALSESRSQILPWAWGMNGALSVTGSVLTRIVSTSAGFSWVLVLMAALYLVAGLFFQANEVTIHIGKLRVRVR